VIRQWSIAGGSGEYQWWFTSDEARKPGPVTGAGGALPSAVKVPGRTDLLGQTWARCHWPMGLKYRITGRRLWGIAFMLGLYGRWGANCLVWAWAGERSSWVLRVLERAWRQTLTSCPALRYYP